LSSSAEDIKRHEFLMGYVHGFVEEWGMLELITTPSVVDGMFNLVADAVSEKVREAQVSWVTMMLGDHDGGCLEAVKEL
jgi:hypothetical protein